MSRLKESLTTMVALVSNLGRERAVGALRAGLQEEVSGRLLQERDLPIHPDVIDLFAWHDGVDVPSGEAMDDFQLFPGFYFMQASECFENYDAFVPSERWNPVWLPVLANGGGDFYVIELSSSTAPVRHFRIDEREHPVEFTGLATFIETVNEACRRGVIYVADGYLEMDDLAFGEIAAANEPTVEWWRS